MARSLAEVATEAPEVRGLLALLLLHDARRPARLDAAGVPVPLPAQDRARWDHAAIAAAVAILDDALAEGRPALSRSRPRLPRSTAAPRPRPATDWREVAALYGLLEEMRPGAAVRASRAFATARAEGAAAGLALLERDGAAAAAPLIHGALLAEVGRVSEARDQLTRARDGARNRHERAQIAARLAALDDEGGTR